MTRADFTTGKPLTVLIKKSAHLAAAASRVASLPPARMSVSERRYVALEARDGRLILRATNLEQAIEAQLPAEVDTPGNALVDAAMFDHIAALVTDVDVVLAASTSLLRIEASGARWRLPVVADKFSAHGLLDLEGARLQLNAKRFNVALGQVAYAMQESAYRAAHTGVHLVGQPEAILRLESTDGHRAAFASCPLLNDTWTGDAILPKPVIRPLRAALQTVAEVEVYVTATTTTFRLGSDTIGTRQLEGAFPDVMRALPTHHPWRVELNTAGVATAVRRALVFAEKQHGAVCLRFAPDGLRVLASHADQGDAEAVLAVAWPGPEDFAITVNGHYLLDFLGALEVQTFSMSLKDPLSPLLLAADPVPIGVVIPLRR